MNPKDPQGMLKALQGCYGTHVSSFAQSESIISALSNVLWGSNCTTDLTQMKPFYPFKSPHGAATTNPPRKVTASKSYEITDAAGNAGIYVLYRNIGFVSLSLEFGRCGL